MNDDMGFEDFYEEGEIFKFKKSHSIDLKSNKEIPKPFKNENKKRR